MRLNKLFSTLGLVLGLITGVAAVAYADDIIGRGDSFRWGFGQFKQLVVQDIAITRPAVNATITVSAEAAQTADTREIVVTLTDADGNAINYAENLELILLVNSGGTDFVVTGGSTGIALDGAPAGGKILAVVAKKYFKAITTTAGLLNLTWLDTGTEVAFLGVRLPNGRIVISSALTNA